MMPGDDVGPKAVAGHDAPPAAAAVGGFNLLFVVVTTLVANAEMPGGRVI
jgi:hypothetical protein